MKRFLVIVESPGKVKTIESFLGPEFKVVSSVGHIRQLGSVPDAVKIDTTIQFKWIEDTRKIENLFKNIDNSYEKIFLATDMDREGEAISWHIAQLIQQRKIRVPLSRITFVEITKKAILSALDHERDINADLVNAYFSRVGLDHKVGFSISPVLWHKFPVFKNQSAGRVQSPALRLITEREFERNSFQKKFYYSMDGFFKTNQVEFTGKLVSFDKKKVPEDVSDRGFFDNVEKNIDQKFSVCDVVFKKIKQNPEAPFITSTLQQEGSKKLGLKVAEIMKIAQELYEGQQINGKQTALITYMRTDSVNMGSEAVKSIRDFLQQQYPTCCPDKPNFYKGKVKNAQEAHECVRPTYINLVPNEIKTQLSENQYKVYNLIWQRAVASQMIFATKEQCSVTISSENSEFRTTTTIVENLGFLAIYGEEKKVSHLPLRQGDKVDLSKFVINEHETQPPGRFTESTLIHELEKYGIGRPSTFVSILETLNKREYIGKKQKFIYPTFKGEMVCCFLKKYFSRYLDYTFTSTIEENLDEIANGKFDYESFLKDFVTHLENNVEEVEKINNFEILDELSPLVTQGLQKKCDCGAELKIRMKFSMFFLCETCQKTHKVEGEENVINDEIKILKTANYQCIVKGESRIYLPQKFNEELNEQTVDLLASLPKSVGHFQGAPIVAGMSKYGFYFKVDTEYFAITFKLLLDMSEEKAIELINLGKKRKQKKFPTKKET